jgi:hypothetical protein
VRFALLVVSLLLLGATAAVLLVPEDDYSWSEPSTTTVAESSTVTVESTAAETATSAEQPAGNSETVSDKTTTTRTPVSSRPSDATIAIMLAAGLGLLLAGAFWDRITSLKAAGVEVALSAKVAEKIAAKSTPGTEDERSKVRAAYILALDQLPAGTSSGDDPLIDVVAQSALERVGAPLS